jgi:hypothetical protein
LSATTVAKKHKELVIEDVSASGRLFAMSTVWKDKPAGLFNQIYHARVSFTEYFDPEYEMSESKQDPKAVAFLENWILVGSYILGANGISSLESSLYHQLIQPWICWSDERMNELINKGANLTVSEARQMCDGVVETYSEEQRNSCVLQALCTAAVDGLDEKERVKYFAVCVNLGIDQETADFILETYDMERELMRRYRKLELPKK